MKIRAVALFLSGFLVGALILSIPMVSRSTGDVLHYVLNARPTPLSSGGMYIDWADAEKLLREGHVRRIMIPHSGKVTMKLDNGVQIQTQEPRPGSATTVVREAPNRRWMLVGIE